MKQAQFTQGLLLLPFGGVGNVTKNMFIYEHGDDILVIDCGIGFPDEPSPDQELQIPDFSYLLKNRNKIRGLVISHAHFDHYGAVPNLLQKINVPIYCSNLAWEFIKMKLEESDVKAKHIDIRIINQKQGNINIGCFNLTPFHINHSIPQSLGFFIKTPIGNIFHVADFKFDFTPIDEEPFAISKVCQLASGQKPLLLLSDCLGAAKDGFTESEATIQEVLENIMIRMKGLVLVTTISTNISRMKQTIQASVNVGRKVAFLGRSLEQSSKIASKFGYFASLKNHIVSTHKIKKYPLAKLTVMTAGSYAQSDSALMRISQNKHHLFKLKKGDAVIFSADPSPPGVLVGVNNMIDDLTRLGAKVYYYEIQDNLHVSGHGIAEDIKLLIAMIKPNYLIPIGGNYRHMAAYSALAKKMGYQENKILLLKEKQFVMVNKEGNISLQKINGVANG